MQTNPGRRVGDRPPHPCTCLPLTQHSGLHFTCPRRYRIFPMYALYESPLCAMSSGLTARPNNVRRCFLTHANQMNQAIPLGNCVWTFLRDVQCSGVVTSSIRKAPRHGDRNILSERRQSDHPPSVINTKLEYTEANWATLPLNVPAGVHPFRHAIKLVHSNCPKPQLELFTTHVPTMMHANHKLRVRDPQRLTYCLLDA